MTMSPGAYERSARARIARFLDVTLPVVGIVLVLAAVVVVGAGWPQIWMAVVGLLLVEAGVWRLGSRILHERRYLPLRFEVQRFVALARDLHHRSVAVRSGDSPRAAEELEAAITAMRSSLDRMVAVAGKTEADLEREAAAGAVAAGRAVPADRVASAPRL